MSLIQERSFIAILTDNKGGLSFLSKIIGWDSRAGEGNVLSRIPEWHDRRNNEEGIRRNYYQLIAYFACYGDYYNIQIRSPEYFEKYISKNPDGNLGAFPAAGGNTTSYNLLNDDKEIITLDDLAHPSASVYLKARNAGIIKTSKETVKYRAGYYFNDQSGDTLKFNLEILHRNVDYPTGDPIVPCRGYYCQEDED